MLVIRLTRFGKKKKPFYRIVVAEKQAPIQGKYIDKIGHFNPLISGKARIFIDKEKTQEWIKNGAKPSDTVWNLLVEAGILKKKIITKYSRKKKEKTKTESSTPPTATSQATEISKIEAKPEEKPEKLRVEENQQEIKTEEVQKKAPEEEKEKPKEQSN